MKSIDVRIFFFVIILLPMITAEKRIVCYYTNWAVYRHVTVPVLYPDEIDASLCTHIHFAFAAVNLTTLEIEPSENHDVHYTSIFTTPLYVRLYSLKQLNPSIKLLITVGGWSAGSQAFNKILTNSTTRSMFIRNTKEFLIKWRFDGIDLDWEFPGDIDRGARNDSREQFTVLIKEIHQAFRNESEYRFLLSAAVSANPAEIDQGYLVPELCYYLDYVNIMNYDYHGAWDNVTGMNAPLYGRSLKKENKRNKTGNVNGSIYHWLSKGCPTSKINLGLALYGRSFMLTNDSDSTRIGSEATGSGLAGPYTNENGTLAYFEICQKLRVYNWTNVFDIDTQAPYAYSSSIHSENKQWVGFDDLKSITLKVLYAQSLDLGGVMLWSLDQDDYTGLFCGEGKFPLTRRVYDVLRSSTDSIKQELVGSFITTELSTEQNRISFISGEWDITEGQMLTSTPFFPNWRIFNSSAKNIWSFYLFLVVLLCQFNKMIKLL